MPNEEDLEELVLKESIVSATGINSDSLQVGIRGDPSLRETTFERKRYRSVVDEVLDKLTVNLEDLLVNRTTYRLFLGFNNGEIRTNSIFDPLRQETHSAEKMADHDYIKRQFPLITYEEKIELMQDIYSNLYNNPAYGRLPGYWRNIMDKRNAAWQPMNKEKIPLLMSTLHRLRDLQEYYLRNLSVCIVQDLIRVQFNCDGTQIIRTANYERFLEENLP